MIAVKLTGGLGNQLFSYSVGRKLALKNNTDLYLYIGDYFLSWSRKFQLNYFNINAKTLYLQNKIKELNPVTDYRHKLHESICGNSDNLLLTGDWQSPKYFEDIRDILLSDLRLKVNMDDKNSKILDKIRSQNSVCIHFRLGDYVSRAKTFANYGNICTLDYYKKAIGFLNEAQENLFFYIFSDNPDWVKANLQLESNYEIININKSRRYTKFDDFYISRNSMIFFKYFWNDRSYYDFELMRNCRHFIISNSTFSWWAAWLSDNHNKMICCPPKWTNLNTNEEKQYYDLLIPSHWFKIPNN